MSGQNQAASYTIKETQADLLLKIADLPRQRRLPNAQVHRRFRHRAKVGDGDKGFQAPEIHGPIVFRGGIELSAQLCIRRPRASVAVFAHELGMNGSRGLVAPFR